MLVLALVLYVLWLVLGFAVRMSVQRRRTGSSGVQGFGAPRGTAAWWATLLLAVAHPGGIAGPVAGLLGLGPVPGLDSRAVRAAGLVLVLAGMAAGAAAQLAMGDSWRIGVGQHETTDLVTGGPFRIVRNPIFSAVGLTSAGFALLVGNVVALAAFLLLVAALQLQVRMLEEPYLRRTHGRRYEGYAATVGRFLPYVGRLSRPRQEAGRI
ncbi:methyltransferase family protein [Actinomadura verrucosospora]|nr:isoprenylcysteine carboxylmethyltransferase family protein [Actinomadura verrucosospora]